MTEQEISEKLVRSNDADLPDNLVGAAVLLTNQGYPQHAGIIIRYKGITKLFHYTGREVLLEDVNAQDWYFHKDLTIIKNILLPSFLAQCELIQENARPMYGYFYSGSLYNNDGTFIDEGHMPEYMTCVGFCINVIQGLMPYTQYFQFDDWDEATINREDDYLDSFLEKVAVIYPDVNMDDFRQNLRRILPVEYLAGAYSNTLPITKEFTDSLVGQVETVCEERVNGMVA
jgi:hypothetical protein